MEHTCTFSQVPNLHFESCKGVLMRTYLTRIPVHACVESWFLLPIYHELFCIELHQFSHCTSALVYEDM